MGKTMNLNEEQAVLIANALGSNAAGWLSGKAIDGPESAAVYVKLACEKLSSRNGHVTESGEWSVDGDGGVSPEQSAKHVTAAAESKGLKALKAIDDGIQDALDHDTRLGLLAATLYATGRTLEVAVGKAPEAVTTAEGDSLDSMPEDMRRQMMELMGK